MKALTFVAALGLMTAGAAAEPRTYVFTWAGAGGYTMSGAIAFDSAAAEGGLIFETAVDCFEITGFQDGAPVGRWALKQVTDETTWTLTFDITAEAFVVYGENAFMPQAWNMDGYGENCGPDGFGFNIGNAAQDLCLDGQLVFESQVDPSQPFPAERVETYAFSSDACLGPELISRAVLSGEVVTRG